MYSSKLFSLYVAIGILLVGIKPGSALITSGILLTILAQVNSTVLGSLMVIVVSGSP